MGGQLSVDHCYFAVEGFDMNGADIKKVQCFKNQGQAIQYAKDRIGINQSLCGVVRKENDETYSVSIKPTTKSNPTDNAYMWHRCLNIFYGKSFGYLPQKDQNDKANHQKPQQLRHFLVNLDMCGGDLQQIEYSNFQEAYSQSIKMIKLDSSKCATIVDIHSLNKWRVFFKDPRKTNPSQSSNHHFCQTVFVGKKI